MTPLHNDGMFCQDALPYGVLGEFLENIFGI